MLGNLLALVGIVLVILGVLKLVGLLAIGTASAALFIVVGAICILVAYFVLGGVGGRSRL